MFTVPTAKVLSFNVPLQLLGIELESNVIIADNGALKSNETQKTNKQKKTTPLSVYRNNFLELYSSAPNTFKRLLTITDL